MNEYSYGIKLENISKSSCYDKETNNVIGLLLKL